MLALSLLVAASQAVQAKLAPRHEGLLSRLLIAGLCYAQPLVRSWRRYRTRLFACSPPRLPPSSPETRVRRLQLTSSLELAYWSENDCQRTELLGLFIAYLIEQRWGTTIDSGWSDWDVEVHCHPWTFVRVYTAEENHGGGRRLIRVRYRLRVSAFARALGGLVAALGVVVTGFHPLSGVAVAGVLFAALAGLWWRGARLAGRVAAGLDGPARSLGLLRCAPSRRNPTEGDTAEGASGGAPEEKPSPASSPVET
jgi:hypothetical protein